MNILVIDTATEACSVALELDGKVYSRFEICPQQHSQRILPMIDEVLSAAGISLDALDYLGFGRGPGSFTGVRIATGILQGLALGTGLKVVGISTLATMAQQALMQNPNLTHIYSAIDARMSEVYFAHYQVTNGLVTLIDEEWVLPPESTLSLIKEQGAGVGTGWQAYTELNPQGLTTELESVLYPNAEYILPLAKQAIQKGLAVEVEDIQPVYLRDKVTWKKLPGRE